MTAVSPVLQRAASLGVAATAAVAVGVAAWFVLGALAPVLGLFFGGWLLGCVLEPCVATVGQVARVRRSTAVVTTYALVAGAFVVVWIAAAPAIARQVDTSVRTLPARIALAEHRLIDMQDQANTLLADRGIPGHLDVEEALGPITAAPWHLDSSTVAALSGAVGLFGSFAIMLLLSVFFLRDGPALAEEVAQSFGRRFAGDVKFVQSTVHDAFEAFLRAQLLQAVVYGAGVWTCLSLAHVDTAPLIGVASGLLLLVPVVGAPLAVLAPLAATLLWNPSAMLGVGLALLLLQQLVLNVVGPRLMSRQLGLPPLVVLFGILAGAQVGGLWGAVFGVPVLAVLLTCAAYFRKRWSGASESSAATNSA